MIASARVGPFEVQAPESLEAAAEVLLPGPEPSARFALAVNPEKVMMAIRDPELAATLSAADFCYPDGVGVVWAMRRKGAAHVVRIPGADLWLVLLRRCAALGLPVYLLGSREEVLHATLDKLRGELPGLRIAGARDGHFGEERRAELIEAIAASGARLVSVALGSPRQEAFIREAAARVPRTLFMGVGGSYDVYVGRVKRAPALWRRLGLEWLYRLLREPRRWRRQLVLLDFACRVVRRKL